MKFLNFGKATERLLMVEERFFFLMKTADRLIKRNIFN